MSSLNQTIYKIFTKTYGLTVQSEAIKYINEIFKKENYNNKNISNALDTIARFYIQNQAKTKLVTRSSLEEVIQKTIERNIVHDTLGKYDNDSIGFNDIQKYFHILDAFSLPKYIYNLQSKTFRRDTTPKRLFANAQAKGKLYQERYNLIKQRILRNELFNISTQNLITNESSVLKITPIKSLLGSPHQGYVLFGMLTKMQDGKYHLEDPDAHIELEFPDNMQVSTGLFTEDCFVLVNGEYTEDLVFRIIEMGMPIFEKRENTLNAYKQIDYTNEFQITESESVLKKLEKELDDVCFVILSEVFIDQPKILLKLRTLFEGYSKTIIPYAFIFIGNFSSRPFIYNGKDSLKYKESFDNLCDLLLEFPKLISNTHFLFIPGPNDPWGEAVIPRSPIPNVFTEKIRTKIPNIHFLTNPCRLYFFTQEIVIFREDLVNRMRRNCIVPPDENNEPDVSKHLIKTILEQSYLCPLPIHMRPVYWSYSYSLQLYPAPDTLILADKYEPYSHNYNDCRCINPGSFSNSDYIFSVYYPSSKNSQDSKIV
ncbi:DNA polymerase epsilon, subunit B [Neocallimastix lanati (nom. inval.)]|jgi:DNA polymerase epsilon subunit 2|uniref:DNA polymerase epsilon subunit n=1 Tax=Neocallimastix californiae TaxID=1754190 RepID=A0A1Y1Z662_9FUNG|nr:DNA polymerase epsilon, subunit B [Neocallimastix sp. JGI-2020a]ORY05730.1 DNA polymerase epsilon, subunit B [Neocallimastix californiae]|eukprot:ORY05730.1 DNA polymerase epsilon, subunit B [Neocallimastix californiae]